MFSKEKIEATLKNPTAKFLPRKVAELLYGFLEDNPSTEAGRAFKEALSEIPQLKFGQTVFIGQTKPTLGKSSIIAVKVMNSNDQMVLVAMPSKKEVKFRLFSRDKVFTDLHKLQHMMDPSGGDLPPPIVKLMEMFGS